jgi:RHS repeat-associated protein
MVSLTDKSTRWTDNIQGSDTYTGATPGGVVGQRYYRQRVYQPQLGRFLSRDPVGYRGSSDNLYEYMAAAPNGGVDPFGERGIVLLSLPGRAGYCGLPGNSWSPRPEPIEIPEIIPDFAKCFSESSTRSECRDCCWDEGYRTAFDCTIACLGTGPYYGTCYEFCMGGLVLVEGTCLHMCNSSFPPSEG